MANRLNKITKPAGKKPKPIAVKIVNDESPRAMPSEDRRWKAESALRTLAEADRIRRDRSLMKEVKSVAKEQMKQLTGVCK